VFLGIFCLVGLPSNIAVIIAIVHQWNKHMSFTLKLMLNLAISDSLVLSFAPFGVSALLNGWTFGVWSCKILMYLVYCAMYGSVLIVTLMAAHHYHTIKSKVPNLGALERLQKARRRLLLIGLWGLATVFALPILFIQNVQFKRGSLRCQRTITSTSGKVAVLVLEVLFGYVLPFTIIAASYCWICKTQLQGGKNIKEKKTRMRRLVISIVTVFFLFWTPVHIINMIDIATTLTKTASPDLYAQLKLIQALHHKYSCLGFSIHAQLLKGTTAVSSSTLKLTRNCLIMDHLNFSVNQSFESDLFNTNGTIGSKQVGAAVFLGIFCLVGLASNIAVIIAIVRQWNKHMSFTLKLMLNLAISDSLVLIFAPFGVSALLNGWTFGVWSCKILMYLVYCAMYGSVLIVTLMAAHHYHTIKSKVPNLGALERLQKARRRLLLIGLWGLATVFALPILFIQNVQFKRGSLRCQRTITSTSGKVAVLVLEVLFGYVLPFTVIAASYRWICKTQLQGGKNIKEKKTRMRRLVISIVTVFFLFWTPVHIINMI
ncbi:leukotriene B4 receptor 1-like, partial [Silurus asotus]